MTFLATCQGLVAEFQALLVPDWNISVELFDGRRSGRLIEGECYPDWQYKGGLLRFHDFDKFPVEKPIDPVLLVAHEMGHCVVAVMCTKADTWERRAEEWIVETYARAMVALKRGMQGAPTRLAAEMRHLMKSTMVRRRMAGAEGKRRMNPDLAKLILDLGAMLATEEVSAELRAAIEALVAKATGGEGETIEEEIDPAADPNAPPMAVDPEKDPNAPPMRIEDASKGFKADPKAKISALLAQAESDAKRTAGLARKALVGALIASAPDVFPEALSDRRARYAASSPEEIERFIVSSREDAALRAGDGRKRLAPEEAAKEPRGTPLKLIGAPPGAPPDEEQTVVPIKRTGMFQRRGDQ